MIDFFSNQHKVYNSAIISTHIVQNIFNVCICVGIRYILHTLLWSYFLNIDECEF